jgi:hypothetical protein
MPGQQMTTNGKPFLRIVSGQWAQKVDEGTEGAKLRKWKAPSGQEGQTWERQYMNWTGRIQDIEFKDTEFGEQCLVKLDDATLTLNTDSRFFSDMACKLMGADLSQPITFHPYSFEADDGRKKNGVSVQQNGIKLTNYYYDGTKNINGFPAVDETQKARLKDKYWSSYFAEVAAFLREQLQEKKKSIPASFQKAEEIMNPDFANEEIPTDLPF